MRINDINFVNQLSNERRALQNDLKRLQHEFKEVRISFIDDRDYSKTVNTETGPLGKRSGEMLRATVRIYRERLLEELAKIENDLKQLGVTL